MSQGKRRDWREICQEVVTETRPERMDALLEELLRVLEELPPGGSTFDATEGGGTLRSGSALNSNQPQTAPSRQNRP